MTKMKPHYNPTTLTRLKNIKTIGIIHRMLTILMISGYQIDLQRFASIARSHSISLTESIIVGYVAIYSVQSALLRDKSNLSVCLRVLEIVSGEKRI